MRLRYMDLLGAALVTGGIYFALAEVERGALTKPLAALAISFSLKIQGVCKSVLPLIMLLLRKLAYCYARLL